MLGCELRGNENFPTIHHSPPSVLIVSLQSLTLSETVWVWEHKLGEGRRGLRRERDTRSRQVAAELLIGTTWRIQRDDTSWLPLVTQRRPASPPLLLSTLLPDLFSWPVWLWHNWQQVLAFDICSLFYWVRWLLQAAKSDTALQIKCRECIYSIPTITTNSGLVFFSSKNGPKEKSQMDTRLVDKDSNLILNGLDLFQMRGHLEYQSGRWGSASGWVSCAPWKLSCASFYW